MRGKGHSKPGMAHLEVLRETSLLLLTLAERLQEYFADCAAEFDLTAGQAKVLMALASGEPLPMRALAERLGYDPSNLTGLVDRLESRDALRREVGKDDRRVKSLVVTKQGMQLLSSFRQRLVREAGPLRNLSVEQAKRLRDLLTHAIGPVEG